MLEGQFSPGQPLHLEGELPPRGPLSRCTLKEILTRLSMTTNLRVVLDAADAASLPAASTKWLDGSGNGYDFFRGTTGSGADTPTIVGSAGGRSRNEYLGFNGSQFLKYDTTTEAWMNNLHKTGAKLTFFGWFMFNGFAATQRMCGDTDSLSGANTGIRWNMTATDHQIFVTNTSATVYNFTAAHGSPSAVWRCLAVSIDTALNTGILMNHGVFSSSTATYSSPSAGVATEGFCVGSGGNGTNPLLNGGRCAQYAAWEGRALTQAELTRVFNASRARFGT